MTFVFGVVVVRASNSSIDKSYEGSSEECQKREIAKKKLPNGTLSLGFYSTGHLIYKQLSALSEITRGDEGARCRGVSQIKATAPLVLDLQAAAL